MTAYFSPNYDACSATLNRLASQNYFLPKSTPLYNCVTLFKNNVLGASVLPITSFAGDEPCAFTQVEGRN